MAVRWYRNFAALLSSRNFAWFSFLQLLQVFNCHFNSNFVPIAMAIFLKDSFSEEYQGVLLFLSFAIPHVNVVFFSALAKKKGIFYVVMLLLLTKVAVSGGMLLTGPSAPLVLAIFIASNRIFTEGTCKIVGLVISDLVDEDYVRNRRPHTLSAFVFGTVNFISKPGQSLAPLLGSWVLATFAPGFVYRGGDSGYAAIREEGDHLSAAHEASSGGTGSGEAVNGTWGSLGNSSSTVDAVEEHGKQVLFYLITVVPLVCGILQVFSWSHYKLKGAALNMVKLKAAGGEMLHKTV